MESSIELQTLVDKFEASEEASRNARLLSERCRDYYDNKQLTAEEKKALRKRGQPEVINNKIAPKIDFLSGIEQQTRTDPKAFPRTPKHDEAADAATDAIRYVLDANEFNEKASDCFENLSIEGTEGITVEVERRGDKIEIVLHKIRWDRQFIDEHSMEKNCSDASHTGVITWMDLEDAKLRWGDKANELSAQVDSTTETYDDKPKLWYDKGRKRVMVVEMYFKHGGKWHHAIFGKGVWLEEPKLSAYLDEDGLPENPQIFASAKVKRDGERVGICESWLDLQDEINKRRSKALHLLNTRQTYSKEGELEDVGKFKREANKSDGHLEFPDTGEFGKDFGIVPNEGLVGPQFEMYQDAIHQLDTVGANAALSGKEKAALSGRAEELRKEGGMIELSPHYGVHSQFKKRVYRAVWNRIRQFKKAEWWVRVTDNDENLRYVGLNIPITVAEQRLMQETGLSAKEVRDEFGQELEQLYRQAPQFKQPVAVENEVAEMDMDIILDEVPDVVNLQSEQFDLLVKMYQANPNEMNWEDVIEMSSLRNKDKVLGRDDNPQRQQAVLEEKQKRDAMLMLEAEGKQAETRKKNADAVNSEQKALQTSVETELLVRQPPPQTVAII